ncbi:hypothetical protein SESBI_14359 [Sesbania bispinosa]|nr:hypothetical protein SESBI_14359 [Sesbania bispinosa]
MGRLRPNSGLVMKLIGQGRDTMRQKKGKVSGHLDRGMRVEDDGNFIILGTITEILESSHWWYLLCTCMRAVNFDGGPPYCDDCQMEVYDMSPRLANMQLKFAPAFSNLEQAEGKSCAIDFSRQCNSVASEVDATPPSSGQCSSSAPSMMLASKRGSNEADDQSLEV